MISMLTAFVVQPVQAQVFRVTDELYKGLQLKNSAVDSTMTQNKDGLTYYTLTYNGTRLTDLQNAFPDSVKVTWYVTADSTYKLTVYWKAKDSWTLPSQATCVQIDTPTSTTATAKMSSIVVPGAYWQGYDQFGLSVSASASGNATLTAKASKVYLRVDRYFRKR